MIQNSMNKKMSVLSMEYPLERVLLRVISISIILLLSAYLYFVAATTLNIMARKEALNTTTTIEGTIAGEDSEFFALSQSITPDTAASIGLSPIPVDSIQYVNRPGNVGMAGGGNQVEITHATAI